MKKFISFLLIFTNLLFLDLHYCSAAFKNLLSNDKNFSDYVEVNPNTISLGSITREDKISFNFKVTALGDIPSLRIRNNGYSFILIEGRSELYIDWRKGPSYTVNCELDPRALQSGSHEFSLYLVCSALFDSISATLPISLFVKKNSAKLNTSIQAIDFGLVKDDTSETKKVLVKNIGEEVLEVDISVDNDWIDISDYSFFLDYNQEKTINVSAIKNPPDIRGSFTGFIQIKSNGGNKKIQINAVFVKEVIIKLNIGSKVGYIDYQKVLLDVAPEIYKSRTIVPLRFIGEAFGANVEWYPSTNKIDIYYPLKDITISLQINNYKAKVGNKSVSLEVPPLIKNGRTLVPIRFIGEAFGANVEWDPKTQSITLILAY